MEDKLAQPFVARTAGVANVGVHLRVSVTSFTCCPADGHISIRWAKRAICTLGPNSQTSILNRLMQAYEFYKECLNCFLDRNRK